MIIQLAMALVTTFVVDTASAQTLPNCQVYTPANAQACMNRVARALPDYEEPNNGLVSLRKDMLVKVLRSIQASPRAIAVAAQADFVGLVLEHGDEHHIYYFALKKGSVVRPILLVDLNLVDLSSIMIAPLTASDLFLGYNPRQFDVYEDVLYSLKEYRDNN